MTDLTLTRGDSRNYQISILESDNVTPVDITDGILKFAAKKRMRDPNSEAQIFKTSYTADEIQITDAPNGQALLKIIISDTANDDPGTLRWEYGNHRREKALE